MTVPLLHDGTPKAPPNDMVPEVPEMNGTTTQPHGRSVQLAVMAAPSASLAEAVAEARRRHEAPGTWISSHDARPSLRAQVAAA